MSKRSARPRPQNSVDREGLRDRCQAFAQREIGPRWQKAEPHVRAGKLRALAVSGEARLSILPARVRQFSAGEGSYGQWNQRLERRILRKL